MNLFSRANAEYKQREERHNAELSRLNAESKFDKTKIKECDNLYDNIKKTIFMKYFNYDQWLIGFRTFCCRT